MNLNKNNESFVIDLVDARICDLKVEIAKKSGTAIEAEIGDDRIELGELEKLSKEYWANGWGKVRV